METFGNIFLKLHNAQKLKKRPFRLIEPFYKPKTSKKCKGYPLIEFENFRKKVAQCRKKPKGGPFGLASTFGSIKNCGLVRESNPRSPASQKISGPFRVRLSAEKEKKLPTVIVRFFP